MPRTADSSDWYVPLFAGTEVAARSGALTEFPTDDIIGNLPSNPPWLVPGMWRWLDGAATSTLKLDGQLRIYQWNDRSGNSRHMVQPTDDARPYPDDSAMRNMSTRI